MKFDYEGFTERMLAFGVANEFESRLFRKKQADAMKNIDEYTERLSATLTPEQKELLTKIEDFELDYETAVEKQAFYKGYMLACSLFLEK